jgi:hypothetical protein
MPSAVDANDPLGGRFPLCPGFSEVVTQEADDDQGRRLNIV